MAKSDRVSPPNRRLHLAAERRLHPLRWRPPADVHRTGTGWLVKFELAGVQEEHVELHISGRWLVLRGERFDSECPADACSHALEIAYSRFERIVELPESVERARLSTEYCRGMFLVYIDMEETGP